MDGAPVVAVVGSRIEAELIGGLLHSNALRAGTGCALERPPGSPKWGPEDDSRSAVTGRDRSQSIRTVSA
jgi:hypothetical protein